MNRRLIAGIVIIIAACIGLYFWAESEKARFDASLPTPPPPADEQVGGHWHGDEWHAEPHAEEAPPVQPEASPPVATDETEELRRILEALKLPPIEPTELDLEHEAILADLDALLEQQGTLSPAEYQKGQRDIARRQRAWRAKWNERAKETAASIRKWEAKKAAENNQ